MSLVSIGLLLPSSSIRPLMGKDFERAFNASLDKVLDGTPYRFEVFRELIGQGSIAKIEEGLERFFGYEDVDLVVGLTSNAALKTVAAKFEKKTVPFLNNNLGEHFITSDGFNKYILMNSIHLWQQCYMLGYYAVSALGKRGFMIGAVYDSGYAFCPAFDLGMRAAAENSTLDFKFLSMPGPGELSDIKSAFQQIDTSNVDFVFSLFCGEEATIFLEEYHRLGLHEQIPLLGLPFLLEPRDKKLEGVSVITTRSDFKEGEIDPSYQAIYSELGNLSGIAIGQAIIKGGGKIDVDLLGAALNEANANRVYEHDLSPRLLNEIAVIRNSFSSSNELSSECLLTKKVDLLEDKDFLQMRDAGASSWLNPYLGI